MDYIIIEQTKEYKKRIAYNPQTNTFSELEHDCLFLHRGFTHPYGWLKGSGTPPEEHLDVFLLSHETCSLGDELPIKIVGVFKRSDGDHKLIGISPERIETDFSQLPEQEKDDLHRLYPRVGDGEGWFGIKEANEVVENFMKNGRCTK
jgi:inorganic pyrophosphatase